MKLHWQSSAIYPVYGTKKINGKLYLDGGFSDNVPIQPLYDIGYRKFIIIYLTNRKIPDKSKYKNCKFIEVIPDETMKDDMYTVINFERTVLDKYMVKDTTIQWLNLFQEVLKENKIVKNVNCKTTM